jgi:hypothetical protein
MPPRRGLKDTVDLCVFVLRDEHGTGKGNDKVEDDDHKAGKANPVVSHEPEKVGDAPQDPEKDVLCRALVDGRAAYSVL